MKFRLLILTLLLTFLTGCKQESLLQGLEQGQANEVIAVLHRHNIAVAKRDNGKSGFTLEVAKIDFPSAVDILKAYDLPSRKPIQIADMFPSDSLVASPRAEKARLYSGIEQRLEQSLYTITGVVSARVHVSYDLEAGEGGRKTHPVHLSALASYEGDVNSLALINDIKRFLKNSFSDVDYDNISVVLSKRSELQYESPRTIDKADNITPIAFVFFGLVIIFILIVALWKYGIPYVVSLRKESKEGLDSSGKILHD